MYMVVPRPPFNMIPQFTSGMSIGVGGKDIEVGGSVDDVGGNEVGKVFGAGVGGTNVGGRGVGLIVELPLKGHDTATSHAVPVVGAKTTMVMTSLVDAADP
mmetsp:Transcript_4945/g.10467  ORF Transcript_4945/g.10467 Transcript_4945/m.10467 type:complete len:101 (-) Transcript_4945:887-1189(-)